MAAESTRRFTKNLLKPGTAAEIRQTACNAVRHSAVAPHYPASTLIDTTVHPSVQTLFIVLRESGE
ncbi:hypothetical protein PAMP_018556 [Pampus punctatissimus]